MGSSSSGVVESVAPWGVSVHEILGYVTPMHPGSKPRQLSKNQKYPPKLPPLLEGMTCSIDIILALIRIKFDNHDLIFLKDVWDEPYELVSMVPGGPIQ